MIGLEHGADYYITKPFSVNLLRAQVLSTLERYNILLNDPTDHGENIICGIFTFKQNEFCLYKNQQKIVLSAKEAELIRFFLINPNQVFSKEQLISQVWQDDTRNPDMIKVYINYLRNKIEDNPRSPQFLQTIWGIGYTFIAK